MNFVGTSSALFILISSYIADINRVFSFSHCVF